LSSQPEPGVPRTILVVDDEAESRTMLMRILNGRGYMTVAAADARVALGAIGNGGIDVIVSDICMPGMDGITFVRAVREINADIPAIFLTGSPSLETAREAIELGAFRYLVKPVNKAELETAVARALASRRLAELKREALELITREDTHLAGEAGLQARFEKALSTLWIAYQPIVRTIDGSVFGYEALMRSEESSLSQPAALLDAAERLDRLAGLGRVVRSRAILPMEHVPKELSLFVNLHPAELLDDELLSPDAPMTAVAHRIFLEITERAAIHNVLEIRDRVAQLRRAGYRIAVDDLGAGYAGLTSFATLEPDVVKLDMALTQGSDTSPLKRRLIGAMRNVCDDLGILIVAEGIETAAELDTVTELGCDFVQGFYLAAPERGFPRVRAA
jgi:EAL domain-containing protein (putative c-di-GMP-specific phosphodiesterase class I)